MPCATQSWGSEESIQRLPVQQQAYMTAALAHSLDLLGKQQLEATPGLFPALLSGVSARLDSPEGPIRQEQSVARRLRVHAAHLIAALQVQSLDAFVMLYNWKTRQACNARIKSARMVRSDGSIYNKIALLSCI